jgi:hypothetical protein
LKKTIDVIIVLLMGLTGQAFATLKGRMNQKYLTYQQTLKILQDMGITQGNPVTYVKTAETANKDWHVHLFTVHL